MRVPKAFAILALLVLAIPTLAQTILPIELNPAGILVHTKINGVDATLIIDTGAPVTVVSPRFVKGIPVKQKININTGDGLVRATVRSAEIGLASESANVTVVAMPIDNVSERAGTKIDGFLGMNVLGKKGSFRLDLKAKTLTLGE